MKTIQRLCQLAVIVVLPSVLFAQKDSLWLVCPLNNAQIVPQAKNAIQLDPPDYCIVLTSIPDTIVKSCVTGRVTNVETDDEGKFGVVIFSRHNNKDYYLWYTGLSKLSVRRLDNLVAGQPIGTIERGGKMELLMYDFETPVDPMKYLDCKTLPDIPLVVK